ncbi:MAG: lipopolysaccharide export system permease protein [Parvicella sp.]|jgi:lipopolysaccharide export system permease protein
MFTKLDRYIAKKFLSTFIFMILIVMSIAIVIDISERLKDITDPENDLTFYKMLVHYYPYFFIHYVNLFSSLIIFLAVIFFTSIMAQRSEIIAILSNGVSFLRFSRPYFIVSSFLLVLALLSNHYWVPHANKNRIEFENQYIWKSKDLKNTNLEINDSTIVHYDIYYPSSNTVNRLWIENWHYNENGVYEMYKDIQIDVAIGDSLSNNWKWNKVFIRTINKNDEVVEQINDIDTLFYFNIQELGFVNNALEAMTTDELIIFRDQQIDKGANNVNQIEIILYERTAYPFAAYILTMIGLAVGSRKSREGVGVSIIIGLAISFIYIFFMKITTVAATNAGLSPVYAVWVPNGIFAVLAILLFFDRMRNEEPPSFSRLFLPWKWFR